jgi:hypothetical protein
MASQTCRARGGNFLALHSIFSAMVALGLGACGGGAGTGGSTDTTAPTATSTPTARLVNQSAVITVTFSESMNTVAGTWQLSGSLPGESNGGVWSMTALPNDTLTVSPAGTWSANTDRSLIVNARDLAGNAVATVNLTYDVYRGALYYVDASRPDDNGNGLTPATAKKFIHTAMAGALSPATVVVNAGDYRLSSGLGTHVVLRSDVSLYGGYDLSFSARNPAQNITTIQDRSTVAGTLAAPNRAIDGDGSAGITPDTIVDGFTIDGSTQGGAIYTAAILLRAGAAPTLQNNKINGGSGGSSSYGVFNSSSSPTVQNNTIHGGGGGDSSHGMFNSGSSPTVQNNSIHGGSGGNSSHGISNSAASSPTVQNNTIHGGDGGGSSFGIENTSSSPTIQNNLIHGGSGGNSTAIDLIAEMGAPNSSPTVRNNTLYGGGGSGTSTGMRLATQSSASLSPRFDNNMIFTRSGTGSTCIAEISQFAASSSTSPSSLRNNNLFGCVVAYRDVENGCPGNADGDNNPGTCTLAEMNALTDIPGGVSGNISLDMTALFVDLDGADSNLDTMGDNDWHLGAGTPASVTAGGLNGRDQNPAWTFTTDKDGVTRPGSGMPWAIGAYEP